MVHLCCKERETYEKRSLNSPPGSPLNKQQRIKMDSPAAKEERLKELADIALAATGRYASTVNVTSGPQGFNEI